MHEPVIGQIHPFFCVEIELIPLIIANLHHKLMRTSRIDRCEPRYAGTEFTNRDIANYQSWSSLEPSTWPQGRVQMRL